MDVPATQHARSGDLGRITAPTLVLHGIHDPIVPLGVGRDLAERIPGARLLEVDAHDHFLWPDPNWRALCEEWLTFLLDRPPAAARSRRFAAIVLTDLVDSTATSAAMGDERRTELLLDDRGERVLKGIEGSWRLPALTGRSSRRPRRRPVPAPARAPSRGRPPRRRSRRGPAAPVAAARG